MFLESVDTHRTQHELFEQLVHPIEPQHSVRDAEFYIRHDGIIFNADGYAHPEDAVIGNPLYIPDASGDRTIFDRRYRKIFFYPGTTEPVPYSNRPKLLEAIDPSLNQYGINPWPFQYEQVLLRTEFIGFIPGDHAFRMAIADSTRNEKVLRDLENLQKLIGLDIRSIPMALTGTLALGNWGTYHDLDLVFRGDFIMNRAIADRMKQIVIDEPHRRLHEGGKSWLIRFYNDFGVIMCNFFGYGKTSDAPLQNFSMHLITDDVEIHATVSDATHALYTPTIVSLHDVKRIKIHSDYNSGRLPDNILLIVYHTGSRGELNVGDNIWARGGHMIVDDAKGSREALVVVEREGVRNETPPWPEFYTRNRYGS